MAGVRMGSGGVRVRECVCVCLCQRAHKKANVLGLRPVSTLLFVHGEEPVTPETSPPSPPGTRGWGTQGGGKLGLAGSRQAGRIREATHPLSPVAGVTSPERDRPLSLYFAVFTDLLHGDPGPGSRSPPPPDPGGCWASEDSCRFWNVPTGSVDPMGPPPSGRPLHVANGRIAMARRTH